MNLNMDNIMKASFGEASDTLRATFKKTVLIKQYETEVIELETTIKIDEKLTGAERMFITAMMQVQLEYTAYIQLAMKGLITQTELNNRRLQLEESLQALKTKAESVLNKSMDKWLEMPTN